MRIREIELLRKLDHQNVVTLVAEELEVIHKEIKICVSQDEKKIYTLKYCYTILLVEEAKTCKPMQLFDLAVTKKYQSTIVGM